MAGARAGLFAVPVAVLLGCGGATAQDFIGSIEAAASSRSGDAAALTLQVRRAPGDGATLHVEAGATVPVALEAVTLAMAVSVDPAPLRRRVLVLDPNAGSRVLPLTGRAAGPGLVATALPDRSGALIAGVVSREPLSATLTLEPAEDGTLRLTVTFPCGGAVVDAQTSWTSPRLFVRSCADAWAGLEEYSRLLDPFAAAAAVNDVALDVVLGDLDAAEHALDPIVLRDGVLPTCTPAGVPLDLFAGTGRPSLWVAPFGAGRGATRLALVNWYHEPSLRGARFVELGLAPESSREVADAADGTPFGAMAGGIALPLPPRFARLLDIGADRGETPPGFDVLAVRPRDEERTEVVRTGSDAADVGAVVAETLAANGTVVLNHRGTDVLQLLPPLPALAELPAIVPYRAAAVAEPQAAFARRFLDRAANLEWLLDLPAAEHDRRTWLVSLEAGFLCTPLDGVLADDFPAAAGFVARAGNGLVIVTMDLAASDIDRLARELSATRTVREIVIAAAKARAAVIASSHRGETRAGLFRDLKLDPVGPIDFVPGDPLVHQHWSAAPLGDRFVRMFLAPGAADGERLQELVVHLAAEMPLVIDIPQPPRRAAEDPVVVVVRRAPAPRPARYVLALDGIPVGAVVPGARENPWAWQEDVFVLAPELLEARPRAVLSVIPEGGYLPLARIGLFRWERGPGTPLSALDPERIAVRAGRAAIDRNADGAILRAGGQAFLSGLGLSGSAQVEIRLARAFANVVARCALDDAAPAGAAATVRVLADGRELFRRDLRQGGALQSFAADVEGVDVLRIESTAAESDGITVDVVDLRLLE